VGVDRDEKAVERVAQIVSEYSDQYVCRKGRAEKSGLEDQCADVVFAEAMLTMQTASKKERIVDEVHRVLRPGGRYGIHELSLEPDDLPEARRDEIEDSLREAVRVGARPLTRSEWSALLDDAGLEVESIETRPMHLLEPRRFVADEGVQGTVRFLFNVLTERQALERVLQMRACFQRYREEMGSISIVARKPA
jgi:SAM-dependent methyltransferase